MTLPNVTLAVFSAERASGWVLYYNGVKSETVVSKNRSDSNSRSFCIKDALRYLDKIEGEDLEIRAISGRSGERLSLRGFALPQRLTEASTPLPGFDHELVEYLFDRRRTSAPPLPPRRSTFVEIPQSEGEGEQAVPGLILICSDASIKMVKSRERMNVGTGWVIAYHDGGERVLVGHRSHPSTSVSQTNLAEMRGVQDAMEHLASADHIYDGVQRAVFYCDNVGVVRALIDNEAAPRNLRPMIRRVAEITDSLPFEIEFFWTKGHAENRWNLMADKMAALGSSKIYEQNDALSTHEEEILT